MLKYILLFLLALFIFLLLSKIKVSVLYHGGLKVSVKYLFVKFDLTKTVEKTLKKEKIEKEEQPKKKGPHIQAGKGIELLKEIYRPVIRSAKHIKNSLVFDKFHLAVRFSLGEPDKTAIVYGAVCSVVFPFSSMMESLFKMKDKRVLVSPDFSDPIFVFYFNGIFSIRLANLIIAAAIMLFAAIKIYFKMKRSTTT